MAIPQIAAFEEGISEVDLRKTFVFSDQSSEDVVGELAFTYVALKFFIDTYFFPLAASALSLISNSGKEGSKGFLGNKRPQSGVS